MRLIIIIVGAILWGLYMLFGGDEPDTKCPVCWQPMRRVWSRGQSHFSCGVCRAKYHYGEHGKLVRFHDTSP